MVVWDIYHQIRLDQSFVDIKVQIGHDVGGKFNIDIWACSGDFIVRAG